MARIQYQVNQGQGSKGNTCQNNASETTNAGALLISWDSTKIATVDDLKNAMNTVIQHALMRAELTH